MQKVEYKPTDCKLRGNTEAALRAENDEMRRILQVVFTDLINTGTTLMSTEAKEKVFNEMMTAETRWFASAARTLLAGLKD